jgi:hypothetical protein
MGARALAPADCAVRPLTPPVAGPCSGLFESAASDPEAGIRSVFSALDHLAQLR